MVLTAPAGTPIWAASVPSKIGPRREAGKYLKSRVVHQGITKAKVEGKQEMDSPIEREKAKRKGFSTITKSPR